VGCGARRALPRPLRGGAASSTPRRPGRSVFRVAFSSRLWRSSSSPRWGSSRAGGGPRHPRPGGNASPGDGRAGDAATWRPLSLARTPRRSARPGVGYVGVFLLLGTEAQRRGGRAVATSLLTLSGVALAGLGSRSTSRSATRPTPSSTGRSGLRGGHAVRPLREPQPLRGRDGRPVGDRRGECLALWGERRRAAAAAFGAAVVAMLSALAVTTSRGVLSRRDRRSGARARSPRRTPPAGRLPRGGRRRRPRAVLAWTGYSTPSSPRAFTLSGRWQDRFGVQRDALSTFLSHPLLGPAPGPSNRSTRRSSACATTARSRTPTRTGPGPHGDRARGGRGGSARAALRLGVVPRGGRGRGPAPLEDRRPLAGAAAVAVHGFFDVNLHVPRMRS